MDDTTGQVVGLISTFLLFGGIAQRTCLRGQRTCFGGYQLTELTGQRVRLMLPLFSCCGGMSPASVVWFCY